MDLDNLCEPEKMVYILTMVQKHKSSRDDDCVRILSYGLYMKSCKIQSHPLRTSEYSVYKFVMNLLSSLNLSTCCSVTTWNRNRLNLDYMP